MATRLLDGDAKDGIKAGYGRPSDGAAEMSVMEMDAEMFEFRLPLKNFVSWVYEFDAQGYACPACDSHPEGPKFWQPTEAERESMRAFLCP